MKFLRLALVLIALAAVAAGVATGIALAATRPEPLPFESESAARLAPGPWRVDRTELEWVDPSRPTAAHGDFEGSPERRFKVALWSPVDAPGPLPLVVYSHGFMSTRHGGQYLAEHLASHGYVVVAADFPLSSFGAPGGPFADDVVHQPADVSFLIDRVLALGPAERAFSGGIDRERIGVLGLSLGGLTTTLVAFHPQLRDPRIRAAISIAGPAVMFGPRYFDHARLPFLMIAGTHDAMIQYGPNAEGIPDLVHDGGLITLKEASHAGFAHVASGPMRLLGNPDELGCTALMQNLELAKDENPFAALGGADEGLLDATGTPLPCEIRFEQAMHPGRQHMLTMLAVRAFFESHFGSTVEARAASERYLSATLPAEIADVEYTPARRS